MKKLKMDELEALRRKKLQAMIAQQMKQKSEEATEEENEEAQISKQLQKLTEKILSPEANDRLNNLRIAMPEFARQVEILLVQLYQSGKITNIIDDEQFKQILMQLKSDKEINIKRVYK